MPIVKVNIDSKNLKTTRKQLGLKVDAKQHFLTAQAFDAFKDIVDGSNRETLRPLNNFLDSLGDKPTGRKVTITAFKEFKQQKGMKVIETNLGGARTTVYFHMPKKIQLYD